VYRSTGVLIGNRSSTGVQEIYWGVVVIVLQVYRGYTSLQEYCWNSGVQDEKRGSVVQE
jgi:hypothetical protein